MKPIPRHLNEVIPKRFMNIKDMRNADIDTLHTALGTIIVAKNDVDSLKNELDIAYARVFEALRVKGAIEYLQEDKELTILPKHLMEAKD